VERIEERADPCLIPILKLNGKDVKLFQVYIVDWLE